MSITLPQISLAGGEVSPGTFARVDLQKFATAVAKMENFFVRAEGGASNRAGLRFVAATKDNGPARLIRFEFNEEQAYVLEFGALYLRVYRNAAQVMTGEAVYERPTPYTVEDLATLTFRQSNDVLFLCSRNHAPRRLTRTAHDDWTLTVTSFAPEIAAPNGLVIGSATVAGGSTPYTYRVTAVSAETGEESRASATATYNGAAANGWTVGKVIVLNWNAVSEADTYNVYKSENGIFGFIGSAAGTSFTDDKIEPDFLDTPPQARNPFDGAGDYPGAVGLHDQRVVYGNTTNKPLTYFLSQISQFDNFDVSSPTRDTDAVEGRIVAGQGNEIRFFRSFTDRLFIFTSGAVWSIRPGGEADTITPTSRQVEVEEYLSCSYVPPLTIKSNMLMVAGQQNEGFEVHSLGYDFNTDGYTGSDLTVLARHLFEGFTIKEWAYAERPYRLVACVRDDGKILVMTYLAEHQVFAWSTWATDGAFESIAAIPEGQEDVFYVVVRRRVNGQTVRYVERLNTRQFKTIEQAFFVDSGVSVDNPAAISGFTNANPVAITAPGHGFAEGDRVRIRDVLLFDARDRAVAAPFNDTTFAVSNVATDTFEIAFDGSSIGVHAGGGTARKEVARIDHLDHLEGKSVVILADGNIEADKTVSGGSVTLDNPASIVHAGLPYRGTLTTLPINLPMRMGVSADKRKSVPSLAVRVEKTRGLFASTDPNDASPEEYPSRSTENWGEPAATLTDVLSIEVPTDPQEDASVTIWTEPGLPMTVLAIMPEINIGG